ncbi:MAG: SIS domain-containing protein [Treponema sp.]|jgi:glucosamine--fructose-6-phosphate aminotransferase (isomerizing)|nr:SIS domain-containing protein [Treponema sp.]
MLRLEEIILSMAQGEFWDRSFRNALRESGACFRDRGFKHIYLVGCGTSCYAACYGRHLLEKYAGIPCTVMEGNLGARFSWDLVSPQTLFIGVSHTGGSESVCRTMEEAAKRGAPTAALTGNPDSPLARLCGRPLFFPGGEDDVPTKTRSYIETAIMLLAAALCLGDQGGGLKDEFALKIRRAGDAAPELIDQARRLMPPLAEEWKDAFSLTVVGTGVHLGNAYEGSLKLCEMGWMNSSAFELENYLHGRFRGAHAACPYVIFGPSGPGYAKALDFLGIAHKKGVKALFITDKPSPPVQDLACRVITIPGGLDEEILPLVDIIPLYLLGLHLGLAHGYTDPALRNDGLVAQNTRLADLYPRYGPDY